MAIVEHYLYTCTYAQTFSITVSAIDGVQARALFEAWLAENHNVHIDASRSIKVRRQTHPRPVYSHA